MASEKDNMDAELRHRAETLLSGADSQVRDFSLEEVKALVHDLRVHQVELELQNEELRLTQRELQRVSANYARLYDNAPAGFLTVENNGVIRQANKTFGEMIGVEAHRLVNASFFDFIHEDDRSGFISRFRAFHKNPAHKNVEIRLARRGAGFFYARLEGRVDHPGAGREEAPGEPGRLLLIVSDISQKVEAELQLQNQKSVLRTILDGISDVINLQGVDHAILSCNKAGYDFWGRPPDQVHGRKCHELLGRDRPCEPCPASLAVPSGRPETAEWYFSELGKWFQVRAIPVFDLGNRVSMVVEQIIDIDERKKFEFVLTEKEQRYRRLVDNSLQGLVLAQDNPVRIVFASRPMLEITGYSPEELMNLAPGKIAELIHPDQRRIFMDNFRQRLAGRNVNPRREYQIAHRTKGWRWVELYSSLIDYEGEPATQTAFIDITERKEAEEANRKLEEELRQSHKMEALGTLAGGIAHDFNNLLQAINGYTQVILLGKKETNPDFYNLKAILKAGNRAANLVRQMLLFSRKVEADRRPVDLNEEIEQARRILERAIPKMVDIEVRSGSRLWAVMADPVQFEQVLLNLAGNASDAMPDGGRLIIESRNVVIDENYAQEIFGVTPGKYVLVEVVDTGCGMDRELLEHIFEPFFTTKEIGKGTGLGLASVYGIVKSHAGFINCYSEVGRGTTFKIYLPALETDAAPAPVAAFEQAPRGGTETILLVDDEETVRDFVRQLLRKFGYTPIPADSGEAALEIYRRDPAKFDLVILDIGMPGMGGHKCLQELLRINPAVKVIVASGYTINGRVKETVDAGAVGFVGKPYEVVDFLDKIRAVLEVKK
ncbi:MAG: PAS domain S-box protein [Pseudomonadota bacterium]